MSIALWVVAGALAAMFAAGGLTKLVTPYEKVAANPQTAWAADMPAGLVKFIAAAEVAGAVGLILPGATGIAVGLVPAAAIGVAVVMAGAVVVHGRRREFSYVVMNLIILGLAVFVAVERIGPHPFH